jgi:hypothetical protein
MIGSALLEPGQAQIAAGAPVGGDGIVVQPLATQAQRGGLHGGAGAAQAQIQRALAVFFQPVAGIERQLAAPVIEPVQRLRLAAAIKAQRGLGRSHGQDLEADLGDQAQRAPAARHQARDVVAGHILHDLAAVAQQLALAVDHLQAQHKVAHCAHAGTRRAGQACGDHAAHGAVGAQVRRLESQALALAGQCCLQLGQRAPARTVTTSSLGS